MGVRGPLENFLRLPPSQRWKTAVFVKVQGIITCLKSPFHEITIKFFWQITLHSGVFDHKFMSQKYQNHEVTRLNQPYNASHTYGGGGGSFRFKGISFWMSFFVMICK